MKFIIITPGRTGSSLLSACLADAGANFGMTPPGEWNPDKGIMEDRDAVRAATCAWKLSLPEVAKPYGPAAPLWRLCRTGYRRRLNRLLDSVWSRADYIKAASAWRLVEPSANLGYEPRVILNTRDFPGWAASYIRLGIGGPNLRTLYRDTLESGLYYLACYGGCLVDYDDLSSDRWIGEVSNLTGLDPQRLSNAYEKRFRKPRTPDKGTIRDPELEALYERVVSVDHPEIHVVTMT